MKRNYSLDDFGVTKHELVLENGLKVVFIQRSSGPIFANILMRAGSVFNDGDSGLAHFTEHVIVSGSNKYPTKEAFAGIIDSIGGHSNARTGRDQMSIECEVAIPEHMSNMKEYYSEALSGLYITPQSHQKEIGVITSELLQNLSKSEYISSLSFASIWGNGTNWSNSNLGTKESIVAMLPINVENFFRSHCTVENMLLVIAGGCTVDDVKKTFSDINFLCGIKKFLPDPPKRIASGSRIFLEQNLEQTRVVVGFDGPVLASRESIILRFALEYAHDGLSSRFYKKLRNERGLVYGLGSPRIALNHLMYTGTTAGTAPEKTDLLLDSIFECYTELLSEGISQKEYRDKLVTEWFSDIREIQTSRNFVNEFSDLYPEDTPLIEDFTDWYNFMENVSPEEIHEVLKKYITLDNCHIIVNGKKCSEKYF